MSTHSIYESSVPVLNRLLDNLEHILRKGEANASERDIDPAVFLSARLAPDMATLTKQVQIVASLVKNCVHRLAATEPPIFEETETSFAELYATLDRARTELRGASKSHINDNVNRSFSVKLGPMEVAFTSPSYLNSFTLPNVYFHITTAYNILRHNGVPLGKMDYFGGKMT